MNLLRMKYVGGGLMLTLMVSGCSWSGQTGDPGNDSSVCRWLEPAEVPLQEAVDKGALDADWSTIEKQFAEPQELWFVAPPALWTDRGEEIPNDRGVRGTISYELLDSAIINESEFTRETSDGEICAPYGERQLKATLEIPELEYKEVSTGQIYQGKALSEDGEEFWEFGGVSFDAPGFGFCQDLGDGVLECEQSFASSQCIEEESRSLELPGMSELSEYSADHSLASLIRAANDLFPLEMKCKKHEERADNQSISMTLDIPQGSYCGFAPRDPGDTWRGYVPARFELDVGSDQRDGHHAAKLKFWDDVQCILEDCSDSQTCPDYWTEETEHLEERCDQFTIEGSPIGLYEMGRYKVTFQPDESGVLIAVEQSGERTCLAQVKLPWEDVQP